VGPRGSLVESDESEFLYKVEEERVGVPVKGGLYEVCTLFLECSFTTNMNHAWIIRK